MRISETPEPKMTCLYDGFDIESFEAGKGLWHARIRRADQQPLVIDGIAFAALDVGFAWHDQEAAIGMPRAISTASGCAAGQFPTERRMPHIEVQPGVN